MILKNKNESLEYNGKTYYIGENVIATSQSCCCGLFGKIVEIRDGEDKETDNGTPEICCNFTAPIFPKDVEKFENRFSSPYGELQNINDIDLDNVIMAPDMIRSISENTKGKTITVYVLEEEWMNNDNCSHNTELYFDYILARKELCEKIAEESENGLVERWQDDELFKEEYGDNSYEAYIDGFYSSEHYMVSVTKHNVPIGIKCV